MQPAFAFILASATITGLLGSAHLLYTFHGTKLHPRDGAVTLAMQSAYVQLTRETTVWRAGLGFHASHSMGAMLFALVFGYLAVWHPGFLQQSVFLLALGMAVLLAYWLLARRFWFSIPRRGLALAAVLYGAGLLTLLVD